MLGLRIATVAADSIFASEANYFVELTNGAAAEALSRGYWLATAPPVPHPALTERLRLDGALVVDPTIDDELWSCSQPKRFRL